VNVGQAGVQYAEQFLIVVSETHDSSETRRIFIKFAERMLILRMLYVFSIVHELDIVQLILFRPN